MSVRFLGRRVYVALAVVVTAFIGEMAKIISSFEENWGGTSV